MATAEEVGRLRIKLGEMIPEGGTADDTLFSDAVLVTIVDSTSSFDEAVLEGWEAKKAQLANLVDVTDGAASRAMSDLFQNANEMVDIYYRRVNGRSGRARVGKIVRS